MVFINCASAPYWKSLRQIRQCPEHDLSVARVDTYRSVNVNVAIRNSFFEF
ncbi:hypothetical protein OKW41_002838 [Paraburkholderia sp. UCT70]